MTDEIRELLERQAAWQRSRAGLSWADKLRACVAARRSLLALRKTPSPGKAPSAPRSPKDRPDHNNADSGGRDTEPSTARS